MTQNPGVECIKVCVVFGLLFFGMCGMGFSRKVFLGSLARVLGSVVWIISGDLGVCLGEQLTL